MENTTKTLFQKMFEIQGQAVAKTAENPYFKSKYATLENVMEVLLPLLEEHRLLVSHHVANKHVTTMVYDVDSLEHLSSAFPLPEVSDPQKIGSAVTYAKRYNTVALFNLMMNDDDDGNASKDAVFEEFKKKVDKITSLDELREFYQKNQGKGKEYDKYMTSRSAFLKNSQ